MKKRGNIPFLGFLTVLMVIVALVHTTFHMAVYGTNIEGFAAKGVSGLAIGDTNTDQLRSTLNQVYPSLSPLSRVIIVIEWFALILLITISLWHQHMIKHNALKQPLVQLPQRKGSKTDIDLLYDLLKEKKKIKFSTIVQSFKVKEEIANEWATILESAQLATIHYPRLGEPELMISVENEKQTP